QAARRRRRDLALDRGRLDAARLLRRLGTDPRRADRLWVRSCPPELPRRGGLRRRYRRAAFDPLRGDVVVRLERLAALPGALLHGLAAARDAVVRPLSQTWPAGEACDLPARGRPAGHLGARSACSVQRREQQAGLPLPPPRLPPPPPPPRP